MDDVRPRSVDFISAKKRHNLSSNKEKRKSADTSYLTQPRAFTVFVLAYFHAPFVRSRNMVSSRRDRFENTNIMEFSSVTNFHSILFFIQVVENFNEQSPR